MTAQDVSPAERLMAAKRHLAQADRAWPRLTADSRRPFPAWSSVEPAAEMDETSLEKLAISWTG